MRPTWPRTSERGPERPPHAERAFTLVELLVSMVILVCLLFVLMGMVNQTSSLWRSTSGHIEQYRRAREAFEVMTRRLSQATLNTYLDYVDASGNPRVSPTANSTSIAAFVPDHYARQSELRFISGPGLAANGSGMPPRPTHAVFFQAPLGFVTDGIAADAIAYGGLENLLNTWGYYIEFNGDGTRGLNPDGTGLNVKPTFVRTADRYRYRLMELMQPSEQLSLYNYTAGNPGLRSIDKNGKNWFLDALPPLPSLPNLPSTWSHVLADNVVALVILPKLSVADQPAGTTDASLAPGYTYDSTSTGSGASNSALNSQSQLPPLLTVTMVALDEVSYNRRHGKEATPPASLSTEALFQAAGDTKDAAAAGFARDLQTLQTRLQNDRLDYRVFTTDVSIKGAKWSRVQ